MNEFSGTDGATSLAKDGSRRKKQPNPEHHHAPINAISATKII
jgi:hypothetical protein